MSMYHHPVRDQMSQHPMEHRMLHSRNVQTIIETLDPRRKFLDLAKKNVEEPQISPVETNLTDAPKRIDEKINDAMKDVEVGTSAKSSSTNQSVETFSPKPITTTANTTSTTANTEKFNPFCALSSQNRVNTTVCIVIEIILLLLTFLVCLVSYNCYSRFTKKQIELTKETCKQNKKIIKLLKSMMN